LQTIQELQARALRRADAVDELDRLLFAAKGKRRSDDMRDDSSGLWVALKRLFLPNRAAGKVQKLERQRVRAQAALRIAVDELHQAHCQQLRTAPWSGSLLAPTEAGLRDANEDYHPWSRVERAGKQALLALGRINQAGDADIVDTAFVLWDMVDGGPNLFSQGIDRKIEAMNLAGSAVRNFANTVRLLALERPEAGIAPSPSLEKIAGKLSAVGSRFGVIATGGYVKPAKRAIAALMTAAAQSSGRESADVGAAQDRLEEVNHQISLAAWSKIPARLRPAGR
jgi:hypothetical protein